MSAENAPAVTLRNQRDGRDSQHLWAYLDGAGNLHVDGQDFGPQTAIVSDDGEYEFFYKVLAADIPTLLQALDADPADGILHVLATRFSGDQARDLEAVLGAGVVPVAFQRW